MCDKLLTKFNAIDTKIPITSGLVTKAQEDSGKKSLEKKIENVDRKIHNTGELVS